MLENSVPSEGVKRYAPPQQRNRAVNRRRSGERFERMGYSHGGEVEKNQSTNLRNFSTVDHHEKTCRRMVALEGCCTSDAAHLLSDRWLAALRSCNDQTLDLSERPVMYAGASGSSWGHMKLNQQMDFFAELCHEIHKMNTDTDPAIDRHGSF